MTDAVLVSKWEQLLQPMLGSKVVVDYPLLGDSMAPTTATHSCESMVRPIMTSVEAPLLGKIPDLVDSVNIGCEDDRQSVLTPWFGDLAQRYDVLDRVHEHSSLMLELQALRGKPETVSAVHVYVDGTGGSREDDVPAWGILPCLVDTFLDLQAEPWSSMMPILCRC